MLRSLLSVCAAAVGVAAAAAAPGNRLTYLDAADPFHVGTHFPRLITPQWVGEPGVKAVVTLGIDDLRQSAPYERFLGPILDRLREIDGRAPVSLFCNALDPEESRFQAWLSEGITLEVHTLSHPCPLLAKGDFEAALNTFHGGVELLNRIRGNVPVAFRTPCCDSINSPSPRVFAELLAQTNASGQFLRMDSSIMMVLTTNDPALPRELVIDREGRSRFAKYLPFESFVTTVEDYPYPWAIENKIWEFPCLAPSDWEGQNLLGKASPLMLEDWQRALDAVVLKEGVFNFVFHPYDWSSSEQFVAFIDYARSRYGASVKFLNYREAHECLTRYLGGGHPLRAPDGGDNGVRLLDLNHDGYLDVLIGHSETRLTRLWDPVSGSWRESPLPVAIVETGSGGVRRPTGVRFGVLHPDGRTTMVLRNEQASGAWTFEDSHWVERPGFLSGLEIDDQPVMTCSHGRDTGARLRDIDGDGFCEFLLSNPSQNAVFTWNTGRLTWERSDLALPPGTSIVNAAGEDNGLRFVDINGDSHDDVLFSNERAYGLWLYQPEFHLGWNKGWTRKVTAGARASIAGATGHAAPAPIEEIPAIVRAGPHRNNGAWFHSRHLWVQNEDTAHLPQLVDRRSFDDLLRGAIPPPKSPQDALASFKVRPGFRIELVAAEPLVTDPVAFEWDASGRLWIVEMRDYPLGMDGRGEPGGVVKFLEDRDGDGVLETATEFLTRLNCPTGVLPWRNGVIVSAAPEVFYAEDSDGDGRADRRQILLTGFVEGNQQHRVNGFALGLDGWVYGANGDSGGTIRSELTRQQTSIQGRDFRFKPDTGQLEAIEGQTQFGRVRDDWGDWFGNANYTWLWHYPWPARYIERNPHLALPDLRFMLTRGPDKDRVFPISRPLPRPNAVGAENAVTSACSPAPYRDDLFGPGFATSLFIAEPTENVVHREVLARAGAGFSSARAADEQDSEFLASTDPWFRPVFVRTGPDGALYVADMYRLVIEHPEWIPPDLKERLNLRAGEDRGRIYRIVPSTTQLRPIPRLDGLPSAHLAEAINSPNGWQRDTAMRLILERADAAAAAPLLQLLTTAADPKVRLHALATLALLNPGDPGPLLLALRDSEPRVRAHALRLSEPLLRAGPVPAASSPELRALHERTLAQEADPSPALALQLAFTLGEMPEEPAGQTLAALALKQASDPILLTAALSSALPHLPILMNAVARLDPPPARLLERLVGIVAATTNHALLQTASEAILRLDPHRDALAQFNALAALFDALPPPDRHTSSGDAFAPVLERAATVAFSEEALSTRLAAIRLLGRAVAHKTGARLGELLKAHHPTPIQQAALRALGQGQDSLRADILIEAWHQLGPALRSTALETLLGRRAWTQTLLKAIEEGRLAPHELPPAARQRLLNHGDAGVRQRSARFLEPNTEDRAALVQRLGTRLSQGDSTIGRGLFQEHCASCHQFRGDGYEVGPNLEMLTDRSPEALLIAILDPNRAVEDRYLAYTATTRDGREFTGVLAAELPASVTLRNAAGAEEVILRDNLISLSGTGHSLMAEGFELSLGPQEIADLIAYLGPRENTARP
jgi:putative membrane-bound dehydrogenase-like protein